MTIDDYFEWMLDIVCGNRYDHTISYRKLLSHLYNIDFTYIIPMDRNRANDGIDLRYRFALLNGYDDIPECLDGPCSVLEMILALAIRCEESIMDDPCMGDRTKQWFWGMISSLGLGAMTDDRYDEKFVDDAIFRFLDRKYEPNGRGGLFTIRNCREDMRTKDIWHQLCSYLNTIS